MYSNWCVPRMVKDDLYYMCLWPFLGAVMIRASRVCIFSLFVYFCFVLISTYFEAYSVLFCSPSNLSQCLLTPGSPLRLQDWRPTDFVFWHCISALTPTSFYHHQHLRKTAVKCDPSVFPRIPVYSPLLFQSCPLIFDMLFIYKYLFFCFCLLIIFPLRIGF